MRRFSQRSHLVTLSEINITPLLDLAFVLLIIFIITTPLLEKGTPLQLPTAGGHVDPNPSQKDIRTLDVLAQGAYQLDGQPATPEAITKRLAADLQANPNIVVNIRSDKRAIMEYYGRALKAIEDAGINRISFRSDATNP